MWWSDWGVLELGGALDEWGRALVGWGGGAGVRIWEARVTCGRGVQVQPTMLPSTDPPSQAPNFLSVGVPTKRARRCA